MSLRGWCGKKDRYVNDYKVVRYCRKVSCKWLMLHIIALRKKQGGGYNGKAGFGNNLSVL